MKYGKKPPRQPLTEDIRTQIHEYYIQLLVAKDVYKVFCRKKTTPPTANRYKNIKSARTVLKMFTPPLFGRRTYKSKTAPVQNIKQIS